MSSVIRQIFTCGGQEKGFCEPSTRLASPGREASECFWTHRPVENLFLTSESRYPVPSSWKSQPDNVLPSLLNCTANWDGLLGPWASWKRANSAPTPAKHTAHGLTAAHSTLHTPYSISGGHKLCFDDSFAPRSFSQSAP